VKIIYHWTDIEEAQGSDKVREIYLALQENDRNLFRILAAYKAITFFSITTFEASNIQPYIRYLQYEIRRKNFEQCLSIFDQLLGNFKTHPEVLAFILKEYTEFVNRVREAR
jgi:hypothetical protein